MSKNTLSINNSRGHQDHSRDEVRQEARPQRTRLNGPRDVLTLPAYMNDESKHFCYVSDDDKGTVQRFLDAGYEFVVSNVTTGETTVDRPSTHNESVVTKNAGQGVTAYLMCCPMEYYMEELAAVEEQAAQTEADLFRENASKDGAYVKALNYSTGKVNK